VLSGPVEAAPSGAVVVVDGLFLQRSELDGCFEFAIWLDVPFEETARRMAVRDGTSPDPSAPSMTRYVEAQRTYFRERTPWARADLAVDNTDLAAPRLVEAPLG
jgi:uridine kinase